jgi:hypothetical protein
MLFTSLAFSLPVLILPVAVLTAAFVYARLQREGPLDLISGVSAYLCIMVAVSAALLVAGLGQVLTGILADLNEGYTYGDNRQDGDLSGGLGFAVTGAAIAMVHVWLRARLQATGNFDAGVERAIEVVAAIIFGLVTLQFAAVAIGTTSERIYYGEDAGAPGEPLAFALSFGALWVVYGARVLANLGVFHAAAEAPPEEGPSPPA